MFSFAQDLSNHRKEDNAAENAAENVDNLLDTLYGYVTTAESVLAAAGQAIAALVSLGYSQSEAALAIAKIDATLPVEEIIKLALRSMAGRR